VLDDYLTKLFGIYVGQHTNWQGVKGFDITHFFGIFSTYQSIKYRPGLRATQFVLVGKWGKFARKHPQYQFIKAN
jgi:hypothetical protein